MLRFDTPNAVLHSTAVFGKWLQELRPLLPQSGAPLLIDGTESSATAFALAHLYAAAPESAPLLIICTDQKRLEELREDLEFLLDGVEIRQLPARPLHSQQAVLVWESDSAERAATLQRLGAGEQQRFSGILLASMEALRQSTLPADVLREASISINHGATLDTESLSRRLTELGYSREPLVREPGQFAVRGGIVDVFAGGSNHPYRIELFGGEVESLRRFDPQTQLSLGEDSPESTTATALIPPASELILNEKNAAHAKSALKQFADDLDLPKTARQRPQELIDTRLYSRELEDLLPLFYDKPSWPDDHFADNWRVAVVQRHGIAVAQEKLDAEHATRLESMRDGRSEIFAPESFRSYDETLRRLTARPTAWLEDTGDVVPAGARTITLKSEPLPTQEASTAHLPHHMTERLRGYLRLGYHLNIACHNDQQLARLREIFAAEIQKQGETALNLKVGGLQRGFVQHEAKTIYIADLEIFGIKQRNRRRSVAEQNLPDIESVSLDMFKEGNYVVHVDHGIGIYRGLKHLVVHGHEGDFVQLEYQGDDRLYLPIYRLNLIQPYSVAADGDDASTVALDKLGGSAWNERKAKVRKAIREMAQELLKLYASRKVIEGFRYGGRDAQFSEFEAAFPYTETRDQLRAIDDVLSDMETPRPMDRLICGDVGFGKTEVAMRGAFRAVLDNKQVAVLVPTTILAEQHSQTFKQRFANFPVNVESLSRFKSPKDQKRLLEQLASGELDIIVGTHRMLSSDVVFKDLGLLIIDEEHRFGVAHKEKIKQYRAKIDVIAMTATPIPRTLQMSLYGFRDLSVIETPPVDRRAVQTYVARSEDPLIREAITKELKRGGQVFFVHNRVHTIDAMAKYLTRLVPEARLGIIHGSLDDKSMEEVMLKFMRKEIDILLATTIIESGLDFPNANTILINRADRFGLSQLYQLRGRVGRSDVEAYAYLLIPGDELISDLADKRLRALRSFTDLGSGYRIALRDLEIRGSGNLLGTSQSGHIRSIGIELYANMLENCVRELQGEEFEEEIEPELQLQLPAFIPSGYISEEGVRVVIYRRLSGCDTEAAIEKMRAELTDRFGTPPTQVENLLRVVELRHLAKRLRVRRLSLGDEACTLVFDPKTNADPAKLLEMLQDPKAHAKMLDPHTLSIATSQNNGLFSISEAKNILKRLT